MEKKYTVKEFVEILKNDESVADVNTLKESISSVYVPLAEKMARAQMIVDASHYVKNENKKEFHINSTANYMLISLNLIDMYSPIKIDFNNSLEEYDQLNKFGILQWIIGLISKKELTEFTKICEFASQDDLTNGHEIHNFINNQLNRFVKLFAIIIAPILEKIDDENIQYMVESFQKTLQERKQ